MNKCVHTLLSSRIEDKYVHSKILSVPNQLHYYSFYDNKDINI